MRWIELLRDLINGVIVWHERWGPVFAEERKAKADSQAAAKGQTIDVVAEDVTPPKP